MDSLLIVVWLFLAFVVAAYALAAKRTSAQDDGTTTAIPKANAAPGSFTATALPQDYSVLFSPGEKVERAYQIFRDTFFFTDKRFVMVDRQGLTGSKVSYLSVPYRNITGFAVEAAGTLDLDAELKIWVTGRPTPISLQFTKKVNIYHAQAVLAQHVAR